MSENAVPGREIRENCNHRLHTEVCVAAMNKHEVISRVVMNMMIECQISPGRAGALRDNRMQHEKNTQYEDPPFHGNVPT